MGSVEFNELNSYLDQYTSAHPATTAAMGKIKMVVERVIREHPSDTEACAKALEEIETHLTHVEKKEAIQITELAKTALHIFGKESQRTLEEIPLKSQQGSDVQRTVPPIFSGKTSDEIRQMVSRAFGERDFKQIELFISQAFETKNNVVIQLLKERVADLNDSFDKTGYSFLTRAIKRNDGIMIQRLCGLGADVNRSDKNGATPLLQAVYRENADMIGLLHSLKANLHASGSTGWSPATLAVKKNKYKMIRLLHELGEDLSASSAGSDWSPATLAVQMNNHKMIRFLDMLGVNLSASDGSGDSPATAAVQMNNHEMIRLLHELKVDLSAPDSKGHTPLSKALANGYEEIVSFLIKAGADVEEGCAYLKMGNAALIWGLEGEISHIDAKGQIRKETLEGGVSTRVYLSLLSQYADLFFKQYRPRISEEEISIILGSLRDAISSDGCTSEHCQESLAHLATGQPLIMGLGLSVPPGKGHAIGLVFHNDRCFICNRGYGSGLSGIAIYKFNCADLGPERLLDIGNTRGKTVEEFYQNLVSSQRPVEQIPQKPQKVGNCTWVSMESMFLALLYIVLEKTIPDSGERLKFCKEVYKDFTSFARECSLKEVAGEGKYRNPEILAKLQQKLLSSKRFTENEKKEMLSLLR